MIEQLEDCLLFKTRVFEQKLNKLAEIYFKDFDLHMTYAYILKVVYFKKEINPKELADILYISPSTISRMIVKLIDKGLLIQGNSNSKKVLYLSKKGEEMIPNLLNAWEDYHKAIEKELGKENKENISYLLLEQIKK